MALSNQLKLTTEMFLSSARDSQTSSSSTRALKPIFIGPNGLRAGWRLLIFLLLFGSLLGSFVLIRAGGLQSFINQQKHVRLVTITPRLMGESEAIAVTLLCVATFVMGKFEHRKFREYGLPPRQILGKDFWHGFLWGFLAISGTLFVMFLLHAYRVTGLALHGSAIFSSLIGWGIAFLLSALFEEFALRGYVQYTLASGIGFWPAAFVFSCVFGLGHAFNPGESAAGALSAGSFGLLFCLFLRRTGNLWAAVGFHAAYDWGQTYFYGVPDSAIVPSSNLFHSAFTGPHWLTGGAVGPEASILCPISLLVVGFIFSRYYREKRYPISKADRPLATGS